MRPHTATAALTAAMAGLLMVAAATVGAPRYGLPALVFAATLALLGLRWWAAAALAVLTIIGVLALGDTPPILAMVCGLAAAAYLLTAYPLRLPPGVVAAVPAVTVPALVFASAVLLATALPVQRSSWLPLVTPVAVVLIYLVALRPFMRHRVSSQGAQQRPTR